MADIPATYAGAWMRWALYLHDHPNASEPTFEVVDGADPRVAVPPAFSPMGPEPGTGEIVPQLYVVCTLNPGDGGRCEYAWKEIPFTVKSYGKFLPFERTPENWRKVSASALGRALKEAGYPDDTRELHAVVTWRRRDIELRALAAGAPVDPEEATVAAGRTGQTDEHPDVEPEHPDPAAPEDAEVVGEAVEWRLDAEEHLRPVFDALPADAQEAVRAHCQERNLGPYWQLSTGPARRVAAFARSLAPKPSAQNGHSRPAPVAPPDSPPGPAEAPSGPAPADTGQTAGEQPPATIGDVIAGGDHHVTRPMP